MKEIITIGVLHKEEVIKKIEKFKEKCLKYSTDPNVITYRFSDNYEKEYVLTKKEEKIESDMKFKVIVTDLIINYEMVRFFNDYTVIAKVEKIKEGKNIVDLYDMNYDFLDFDKVTTECEHCKTKKRRKYIYILEHKLTHKKIQVGKSCLKEYMNDQDVFSKLSMFNAFKTLLKKFSSLNVDETNLNWNYMNETAVMNTRHFLTLLVDSVNKHGLITYPNFNCTIYDILRNDYILEDEENINKIVDDMLLYFNVKRFVNDFERKIQYLLSKDIVRLSDFNVLIYTYSVYKKHTQKLQNTKNQENFKKTFRELYKNSDYQGVIGDLLYIGNCRLIESKTIETCYGLCYLYIFADKNDNIYTWFTSKDIEFEDNEFVLKGKIKEHKVYNEVKQTQLTRCKIL